jgi:hypothetical protein
MDIADDLSESSRADLTHVRKYSSLKSRIASIKVSLQLSCMWPFCVAAPCMVKHCGQTRPGQVSLHVIMCVGNVLTSSVRLRAHGLQRLQVLLLSKAH